jgi:hypothetical protein
VSGADGDSDNNDWTIECESDDGPTLASQVHIKSTVAGCFLAASETAQYPEQVGGQFEVFCGDSAERNEWTLSKGIFVGGYVDDDEADGQTAA